MKHIHIILAREIRVRASQSLCTVGRGLQPWLILAPAALIGGIDGNQLISIQGCVDDGAIPQRLVCFLSTDRGIETLQEGLRRGHQNGIDRSLDG